jgi:hypothetical protein
LRSWPRGPRPGLSSFDMVLSCLSCCLHVTESGHRHGAVSSKPDHVLPVAGTRSSCETPVCPSIGSGAGRPARLTISKPEGMRENYPMETP